MSTFVTDPVLASHGSLLVNQIEVDRKPLPTTDRSLAEVVVNSKENEHDTATITARLEATQVEAMKDKTVAFTYGNRNNLGTFYGYSDTIVAAKAYQQDGMYDIECFGMTSPLQVGQPRFFKHRTGPQIVAEIVAAHGLGVQVDDHDFAFPAFAQTDGTDWATIKGVADRLGWVLYNYNGVVRLVDPLRILNTTGPVLRLIRGEEALDHSRQLLDFIPQSRSLSGADLIPPTYGYFEGGKAHLSTPIDKGHRLVTGTPTLNKKMASVNEAAWKSSPARWTQSAQGRIQGNPSVSPGTVVDIQSSGSKVIEHDYDGQWLVRATRHVITHKSFQTLVVLGRNEGSPQQDIDYRPFWAASPHGRPQVVRKGDVWESSWKRASVISGQLTRTTSVTHNSTWEVS